MKKHTSTSRHVTDTQWADWLNTAIPFSVWHWSNKQHIIEARDFIFKDIGETYRVSKNKAKDRSMLLVFLLNLWVGFCVGSPVQISLSKNKYANNGVYGKVFFTYERTIRLLEELERRGYLQRAIGYFTEEDSRETRIWGTEKLIRLFVEEYKFQPVGDVITEYPTTLVQLRNEVKRTLLNKKTDKKITVTDHIPVQFEDTESTLQMQTNLESYNAMAQSQTVTVKLEGENFVSGKLMIKSLIESLSSGSINLIKSELDYKYPAESEFYNLDNRVPKQSDNEVSDNVEEEVLPEVLSKNSEGMVIFKDIPGLMITTLQYKRYKYPTIQPYMDDGNQQELINIDHLLSSMTNTLQSQQWQGFQPETKLFLYLAYIKKTFSLIQIEGKGQKERNFKRDKLLKTERPLIDFGIRELEFEINNKFLHRVFNRGSLDFDKGGRAYGAWYQGVSGNIRNHILINANETVEVDYSGLHIRMLYHDLGLEFHDDPYKIGDGSLRDAYKIVSLVSINAEPRGSHIAVRDALADNGFEIAEDLQAVIQMMDEFKEYHAPIKEFLFSGVGVDLQNKDSNIMEEILMELHHRGIVGLPIHDSVIVEAQHERLLKELMIQTYRKFMDFEPVLKVA
ncbi:MAG: hypothetical protein AB7U45_16220 [Desulfamplus sp.]